MSFVVSNFNQFDRLSVDSLVSFIDPHDPSITGESLSEIMHFEVLVTWIGVSDVIITSWYAIYIIDLPCAIIAEFVHQAILHTGINHVVNSEAISSNIILLLDLDVMRYFTNKGLVLR